MARTIMPLGFAIRTERLSSMPSGTVQEVTFLSFQFIIGDADHLIEVAVNADPDFMVLKLRELADCIQSKIKETKK